MSAPLRKLALTVHVVASVGWLGAVVVFLGLSITALASQDPQTVRAAYLAMEAIGVFILVPFSLVSLLTGVVQGLGTKWGLARHYWVLAKLLINVIASLILLLYTQTLAAFAEMATANVDLELLRSPSPVLHALAGLGLLLAAVGLSIYKPRGRRADRSSRSLNAMLADQARLAALLDGLQALARGDAGARAPDDPLRVAPATEAAPGHASDARRTAAHHRLSSPGGQSIALRWRAGVGGRPRGERLSFRRGARAAVGA